MLPSILLKTVTTVRGRRRRRLKQRPFSSCVFLYLLFTLVIVHTVNAKNYYKIVEDKADCQPSSKWLGAYESAQECADACKESEPNSKRFVWAKHDDKNCKCASLECTTTSWSNGAVYKYVSNVEKATPDWCFWGAGGGEGCSGPSAVNFILAGFFCLWNFMCSTMLLVPMTRFFYFGFRDAQARQMCMMLICPHWAVGIIMPAWQGGLFTSIFAIMIPYSVNGYKINKLCKAERQKGQMIYIKEEVDLFINKQKTMRLTRVRMTDDRLMFTASGKSYDRKKKNQTFEWLLDPVAQANVSTDIIQILAGKRTRAVIFTDKSGQNIKLILTRLVGLVNQDSLEAEPLPERQNSLGQRILNISDPKYQFTAVATPLGPDAAAADPARPRNGLFLPARPVLAVATVFSPDDIEEGQNKI